MAAPEIETQGQRMEKNCKTIWGSHCDYDFDIETDDWEYYQIFVKEDFGDHYGRPRTMTSICRGPEAAWQELDGNLEMWARQKKHGVPKTEEEAARMRKDVAAYLGHKKK